MYEIVEHTADIGLKIKSDSLENAFREAALGMLSLMIDIEKVEKKFSVDVNIKADNLESLLVRFLTEILYIFEVERFVYSDLKVEIKDNSLNAELFGENYNRSKHGSKLLIKAVTYHMISVKENGEIFIIFDI
ncbi:MAG: archease [Thermoplasmata archaeon]|jgi:SHS2 domain-containing protein